MIGKLPTNFILRYRGMIHRVKRNDTLSNLPYAMCMEMVTSSKKIEPHKLPSTERAAFS